MQDRKKALITEEFHPLLKHELELLGYECEEIWDIDTERVINCIEKFHLIVINSKIRIDKALLEKATNLKIIARMGSGLEIIDLTECEKRGVKVISTPEGNANAVAEHTIGFILSALNNLGKSQNEILEGKWIRENNRGEELCGKTIGIIGCGHNGSRLVKLLSGFDVEILVYDIIDVSHRIDFPNTRQVHSMDEIFEKVDIVSFHIPLNQSTFHLVNNEYLDRFRKNIYLINTSRGQICPWNTILYGLENGKLRKVMLDVFEEEPIRLNNIIRKHILENRLFISPHIAGWTYQSKQKMAEMIIKEVKRLSFF